MKRRSNSAVDQIMKKKWVVILIITLFLTLFGRIVDDDVLLESGIVLGMGVDYQNEEFIVSTQLISVTGTAAGAQPVQNYVTSISKAKTIIEALDNISKKMGVVVSLTHCELLILSPSALKLEHTDLLFPLIKSLGMPEQSIVISAEDEPSKLLAQPIATKDTTAFLAQATFLQNLGSNGVAKVTIKDFVVDSISLSGTVRLPYTRILKPEEKPISSSSSDKEYVELDFLDNLIVKGDKTFILPADLARTLNLYLVKESKNKIETQLPTGETIGFRITNKSEKIKTEGMKVNYQAKLTVSFVEAQLVDGQDIITCSSDTVIQAASALEKELENALMECFRISKEEDMDFLMLQNEVYKKLGISLKEDSFQDIDFSAKFEIKVKENN